MRVAKKKTVGVITKEGETLDTVLATENSESKTNDEVPQVPQIPQDTIKQKQLANGKLYNIYQLMGSLNNTPYTAKSIEEYKAQLNVMNLAEMQNHAMNVSVKPMSDRVKLEQRLTKAFTEFISHYGAVTQSKPTQVSGDRRSKALDILKAGK